MPFGALLQVRDPVFLGYPEAARSSGTIWYGNAPGLLEFTAMNCHQSLTAVTRA